MKTGSKFVIAYENESYDGYITEKLFQAYAAGAVPIYYSHPSAVEDINKKAIIYAGDFPSEKELVEYIKKVDNDDARYCDIWNHSLNHDPMHEQKHIQMQLRKKIFAILDKKLPHRRH